jgi:hypothetical protein
VDGDALTARLAALSDRLAAVESSFDQWDAQAAAIGERVSAATAAAPRLVDTATWVLSLLFILFGAGQVSLIGRGVAVLRKQPATAAPAS